MIKLRFVTSGGPAHPSANSSELPPLPPPSPGLLLTASSLPLLLEDGSQVIVMGREWERMGLWDPASPFSGTRPAPQAYVLSSQQKRHEGGYVASS